MQIKCVFTHWEQLSITVFGCLRAASGWFSSSGSTWLPSMEQDRWKFSSRIWTTFSSRASRVFRKWLSVTSTASSSTAMTSWSIGIWNRKGVNEHKRDYSSRPAAFPVVVGTPRDASVFSVDSCLQAGYKSQSRSCKWSMEGFELF